MQEVVCQSLREVDALIAEYLFEWQWWYSGKDDRYLIAAAGFDPGLNLNGWKKCDRPTFPLPAQGVHNWARQLRDYTTWTSMEWVIRNREDAGCWWKVERGPQAVSCEVMIVNSCHGEVYVEHQDAAVAFCLAALASAGVRVMLEPI